MSKFESFKKGAQGPTISTSQGSIPTYQHERDKSWRKWSMNNIVFKQINFLKKATVLIMLLIHCVVESRWCWKNGNCPIQSGMPKNCDALFQWMGGNICELIFNTLASVDFFGVKPACTCLTRTYFIRVSSTCCHVHYWVSWKQRPLRPLRPPPNDSELYWLGLGNWVNQVPFTSL